MPIDSGLSTASNGTSLHTGHSSLSKADNQTSKQTAELLKTVLYRSDLAEADILY